MSYKEYIDIFNNAQKRDCNYFAIFIDIVNSKKELKVQMKL